MWQGARVVIVIALALAALALAFVLYDRRGGPPPAT